MATHATFRNVLLLLLGVGVSTGLQQQSKPENNAEVKAIYAADQADRQGDFRKIDWSKVGPRDLARQQRVRELLKAGEIRTGPDFYAAAMVFQHGNRPEDYLLAHELAVLSASKGHDALWLAAASQDRFLMEIKRPQRFGTQYRSEKGGPLKLYTVDPTVDDAMRRAFKTPTLSEARAMEAQLNPK